MIATLSTSRLTRDWTVLAATAALSIVTPPPSWDTPLFIICVLVIGLPHGALDHLIYLHSLLPSESGITHNAFDVFVQQRWKDSKFWKHFLGIYIGVILAYSVLWMVFPYLSMAIFLALSAFHFGQAQLYFINLGEKSLLKLACYFSWGTAVLAQILLLHYDETAYIVRTLTPLEGLIAKDNAQNIVAFLTLLSCITLVTTSMVHKYSILPQDVISEMIGLAVLYILSLNNSLLYSFLVFYGLWHSLKSMHVQCQELGLNLKNYYLSALPFTSASVFGIGVVLWIARKTHSPFLTFFMCLSCLAAPHMIIGQWMYSERTRFVLSSLLKNPTLCLTPRSVIRLSKEVMA